jgi:transposase
MKKSMYKSKNVKDIDVARLGEAVKDKRIVFGIDIAKVDMYAVFMIEPSEVVLTVKWKHPTESPQILTILRSLPAAKIEAAMESSGSYGDSLRHHLKQMGIPVFRVSAKQSHDSCELYDGVPSSHDAKSAAIVAWLHLGGKSAEWTDLTEGEKQLRSAIGVMELHDDHYHRLINQLEALLARHWPEATTYLELTTASLLELLIVYGSPQAVSASPDKARKLLRCIGRGFLLPEKISGVVNSATTTLGEPAIEEERQLIIRLAVEARRASRKTSIAEKKVEHLSQIYVPTTEMSKTIGKVTAAIVYANVGDPADYSSAAAYAKGMGLNMKERSSGKHKGQLKITKRGPSIVRKYLYFAVLRIKKENGYFQKWHERKMERDGGKKMRGIIALMRKLAKALWYVGQGAVFDARLLFDNRILKVAEAAAIPG